MNKRHFFGSLVLGICFISYWHCPVQELHQNAAEELQHIQPTRLAEKHAPTDELFLERAFPDAAFDLNAYTNALQSVKETAQPRNKFENFDREWKTEGPGNLGARINTVAYHPENTDIILAGFSSGGVFKTIDGGTNWTPVFDKQLFLAIGDIVFDPQEPNTVYVGTGDPNISGFPFIGDGLYKSTDAGETWTHLGLTETRIISKIVVHPEDSDILYVAAMGLPFEPNQDRGVYKTIDGGNTWEQILFLGEETGVIDLLLDINDPSTLYAAGWDRMRNSKRSKTSGLGAKIHRSQDNGNSWQQLKHILPQDAQSRIGLAASQDALFSIYIDTLHDFQGVYRSYDKGDTWATVPVDSSIIWDLRGFGWYFGQLRVNPLDKKDIVVFGVVSSRTKDGGLTWEYLTKDASIFPHVDHHDVVYHPSGKMLLATDGGLYESPDNGTNWEDIEDIPASQTYRVAFNPHQPDYYYGGFQDNGTAGGNAIDLNNWKRIRGSDGFQATFHPIDPLIFYTEKQRGSIDLTLDGGESWMRATQGINFSDRVGWDMPYIMSPHDPSTLFLGTHRIYKSEGTPIPSWTPISEDLTDGPIYERAQSISTISQSPINRSQLYTGTMDANVWRSLDEGATWEAIHSALPERSVTDIVASPDKAATVFVTYSGYKDNDFTPHIFKSDDAGDTWSSIAGDLPPLAINALAVMQGSNDQILFVATDGGVYGTLNGGLQWERLGTNMPVIAAYDLTWNTTLNRLVVGTFARSILSYSLEGIITAPDNTLSSLSSPILTDTELSIFPNPVKNTLNVAFNNSSSNQLVSVSIFDKNGQTVTTFKVAVRQQALIQKELSQLPSGLYIVTIQGQSIHHTGRFVKIQ